MFDFLNPYMLGIKIAGIALAAAGLITLGAYGGYRWELGQYETLVAADAKASADAYRKGLEAQAAADKATVAAAYKDAAAQQKIVTHTITVTKEIPHYVHDQITCPDGVTFGLVRVLKSAESGVDPAAVPLPPGVTDDSCAAYGSSALAADLAADFGAARGNAQQLDDVLDAVKAENDAVQAASKK